MVKLFVSIGAVFCLLGVIAGALGAHALKELLDQGGSADNFTLATEYMFYHGLGLMAVGALIGIGCPGPAKLAGWLLVAGSVLFQGNLYLISLAQLRTFQALTPLGGISLMAGWLALAIAAIRMKAA